MVKNMQLFQLLDLMEEKAPAHTAAAWDNPGLLVDTGEREVTGVVTALDATPAAIAFAAKQGAELLLTHHPVIFHPLSALTAEHPAVMAMRAGISVLCAHTNLDAAAGGVNDTLAALLGLKAVSVAKDGMTRIGHLETPVPPDEFARQVSLVLQTSVAAAPGDHPVTRVAVCGGAAGEAACALLGQADAFLTGEMKHHEFLLARAAGMTAVAAGHYATEVPVIHTLAAWLQSAFPALRVIPFADTAPYTMIGV